MGRYTVVAGVMTLTLAAFTPALYGQDDPMQEQLDALRRVQLTAAFQPVAIQFNFSPPGARSLGMGGAFVALADDATAAFANPAGLLQLSQKEVSIEGRNSGFGSEFINGGHAFGDPSCIGFDSALDGGGCPRPGLSEFVTLGSTDDDVSAASFASFAYPVNRRFAIAVYRHELANFDVGFRSPGFYVNVPLAMSLNTDEISYPKELSKSNTPLRVFPSQTAVSLDIANFGVSAAFRPTDDLSIGLGLSSYQFTYSLTSENYGVAHFTDNPEGLALAEHPFFQESIPFTDANLATVPTQRGDNNELGVLAGFLWNFADRWTLGGVFRQGPEHDFEAVVLGPDRVNVLTDPETGEEIPEARRRESRFHVPDVLALGLVFRPKGTTKISFEYTRVAYSNLTDQPGVPPFGLSEEASTADDADELHIGFEHVFLKPKYPIAVRVGAWNDPDHRIRFEAPAADRPVDLQGDYENSIRQIATRRIDQTLLRPGANDFHYSGGVGIVINKLQLDAAIDVSDLVDTISFSGVVRF